jgi:Lipid-A-disaccharide synthetase
VATTSTQRPGGAPFLHASSGNGGPANLILVSSGPGELSNWAIPMARAAAAWSAQQHIPLRLSLVLPPCQFASGQEVPFARRQGLFAHILGPGSCLAVVAGLARFPAGGYGCVLHLGGDLWYSSTLAWRLGISAFAYVETDLIHRRAHRFDRIFVPAPALADRLLASGVPSARLCVAGDLRVDHLAGIRAPALGQRAGARVALLPGSRRWIIEFALPFLLDTAVVIRSRRPDVRFSLVASPFLSAQALADVLRPYQDAVRNLGIDVIHEDRNTAVAGSDLAITLPGTNTVELAILGIPMLVMLPLNRPAAIRTEGLSEWFGRIPGVGTAVKVMMVRRFARHPGLVALPNREAGRVVVPELVGRLTPAGVADRALALLDDGPALERMAADLRGLYATPPGVAQRMLDAMAPCLAPGPGRRAASA